MALGQGNTITNQNRHAPPHAGVADLIPSATAAGPSSPDGSAAPFISLHHLDALNVAETVTATYNGMRDDWGTGESLESIVARRDLPISVRIDRITPHGQGVFYIRARGETWVSYRPEHALYNYRDILLGFSSVAALAGAMR